MSRFAAVRCGYGALLVLAPDPVVRLFAGHRADRRTRTVTRLVGARHLAQGLLTAGGPGPVVLALGVEADLVHSASMVVLAACDPTHRRAGLVDALGAGGFAVVGTLLARWDPAPSPPPVGDTWLARLAALRQAAAEGLARWLLPWSRRQTGRHPTRRRISSLIAGTISCRSPITA